MPTKKNFKVNNHIIFFWVKRFLALVIKFFSFSSLIMFFIWKNPICFSSILDILSFVFVWFPRKCKEKNFFNLVAQCQFLIPIWLPRKLGKVFLMNFCWLPLSILLGPHLYLGFENKTVKYYWYKHDKVF